MPMGPGAYDNLCTYVREQAKAQGAIVIVLGGEKGQGFSMQADAITTLTVPDILERVAKEIRASFRSGVI